MANILQTNNNARNKIKRVFDIMALVPALIFFLPQMAFIALLIRFSMGKPVLYRQCRYGLNNKEFTLYKFRIMASAKEYEERDMPGEKRLTYTGRILQSLGLDDLPELFNVLKGDMGMVGPRPLLAKNLELLNSHQQQLRHTLKPGITGWAQINGHDSLSWEDRVNLDIWYVDNWSLWLDIKISFITLWKILKRESIN